MSADAAIAKLTSMIERRIKDVSSRRALVAGTAAGLVTLQELGATSAGTEQYARASGLSLAPNDEVIVAPINGKPFVVAKVAERTIQAAVDAVESGGGGTVVVPPGQYSGEVLIDGGVRLHLVGYGATLTPGSGETALAIDAGNGSGSAEVSIEGFLIDGNDGSNTVGVLIENSDRAALRNLRIQDCATGVHLLSASSGGWVEGASVRDTFITGCGTGMLFETTGTGTGSFAETILHNVPINDCTVGIDMLANGSLYRSNFAGVTFWLNEGQRGMRLDGIVNGATFQVAFESMVGSPTTVIGLDLQDGCTDAELADWHLNWVGNFSNQIVLTGTEILEYRQGSNHILASNAWIDDHVRIGSYHLWVDSTGDLRIKSGVPTSDTDGTVVGTQS